MKYQKGDRVRVKMPDGSYHAGVIEKPVKLDTQQMYWVIYSGSRPDYYPHPICHPEHEIEPLQ